MSNEFDWHNEHTAHAKMLRFSVRVIAEYGSGINYENAKEDALTYASLLLEHFWDNRQPNELAEEINFRKTEIVRWTRVLDQAYRGNLEALKKEIFADAQVFIGDVETNDNLGRALLNLANSINS